jgi:hypothetical protein
MDFKSKKFWVFVAVGVLWIGAAIFGKPELTDAAEKIMAAAAGWGILDTAVKFATKNGGTQ